MVSESEARRALLEKLGIKVEVAYPRIQEVVMDRGSLQEAEALALENASRKLSSIGLSEFPVPSISVDTLILFGDRILGKPRDAREAAEMLASLRGRPHYVVSGFAVAYKEATIKGSSVTKVFMRNFDDDELEFYIQSGEWRGRAGGYAIQGLGGTLIRSIEGCYFNVVGLPLPEIVEALKSLHLWPPVGRDGSKGTVD